METPVVVHVGETELLEPDLHCRDGYAEVVSELVKAMPALEIEFCGSRQQQGLRYEQVAHELVCIVLVPLVPTVLRPRRGGALDEVRQSGVVEGVVVNVQPPVSELVRYGGVEIAGKLFYELESALVHDYKASFGADLGQDRAPGLLGDLLIEHVEANAFSDQIGLDGRFDGGPLLALVDGEEIVGQVL